MQTLRIFVPVASERCLFLLGQYASFELNLMHCIDTPNIRMLKQAFPHWNFIRMEKGYDKAIQCLLDNTEPGENVLWFDDDILVKDRTIFYETRPQVFKRLTVSDNGRTWEDCHTHFGALVADVDRIKGRKIDWFWDRPYTQAMQRSDKCVIHFTNSYMGNHYEYEGGNKLWK